MLEELVLSYVNEKYAPEPPAQRIGVSGQSQNGVDVYAYVSGNGHMGFQSKAYVDKKLTPSLVDKEIRLCHEFSPSLDFYAVVTLNSRDAKLQEHIRSALLHGKKNRVSVIALEDLASIVDSNDSLKRQLLDNALRASDFNQIKDHFYPPSGGISTVSIQESEQFLPEDLRIADEWVDSGMPLKALSALDSRRGHGMEHAATLIRCRALYSLEKYEEVVSIADTETSAKAPHAPILIIGALAANELGNKDKAEKLAESALQFATQSTRANVVGGTIRLRAKHSSTSVDALEAFAKEQLGQTDKVAVALADSAAALGNPLAAARWFKIARESRPSLPLGVQINELATALVIATDRSDNNELSRIISRFEQILESIPAPQEPSFKRAIQINLGAAFRALGRTQEAASIWDNVLTLNTGQREVWIYRCLLSEQNNDVQPPDKTLAAIHATDPITKLAYASALISVGDLSEAAALVTAVLGASSTTPEERSIAHVERLRIRLRTDGQSEAIKDGLEQAKLDGYPTPLLNWISSQHSKASQKDKQKINDFLQQIKISKISDDAVIAIASPIAFGSSAIALGSWINRLKEVSFGSKGEIRNEHAAEILAKVQTDTLDFAGSIRTLNAILEFDNSSENLVRLAQAYYLSGERSIALDVLQRAIVRPDISVLSVRNWAQLSVNLGRRRQAVKFFNSMEKPQLKSPNDYILLMQTRLILGIKEDDADAAEFLRSGHVTQERATQVFSLGVGRKAYRPTETAARGTFVTISIENELDDTFYITESASNSMPGVRSLDPENYPWVSQLIGQKPGAEIKLFGQPFDGKIAKIKSVRGASDFLYAEALQQIGLSSTEKTGVRRLSGDPEFFVNEAKKLLADRHKQIEDKLAIAQQGHFPASLMAKLFHTTPRDFLFKSKLWTPQSHSGGAADIQADESATDKSEGWIFDATTVLLLALIDAEEFPHRLLKIPRITKTAISQLCDWRAHDRDQRRAAAHMNLNEDGSMYFADYTAADRVAQLKFWKKVEKIKNQCRVIDVPTVELSKESIQLLDLLDPETISTFHAAKFHKLTLISEEISVRMLASMSTGASSASLTALLIESYRRSSIKSDQTMVWISRLIELGWTWVWFPTEWLWQCFYLPEANRSRVFDALYSRMKTADPKVAIPSVLSALTVLDRTNLPTLEVEKFRRFAIANLPELDATTRLKLLKAYAELPARHRASRQTMEQLAEWSKGSM